MRMDSKLGKIFEVGDVVIVRDASTRKQMATGNIATMSKTQLRITVDYGKAISVAFYKERGTDRYVANPGAGLFGSMLNDYFLVHDVKSPEKV